MADQQGFRLFGFKITRGDEDDSLPESAVTPNLEDGAINIQTGAHYGIYVDLDGTYRTEVDLITKYRTMSMQPEMESAIEDIINEAIVHDEEGNIVRIELENLKQPDNIKKMIRDEFDECLKLLDFNNFGSEIFRRWYVDGRCYYNVVIDKDDPRAGIKTLIYIDPRRIRKIRNITKIKNPQGIEVIDRIDTFYLYNEKVVNSSIQSPQIVGSFAGGVKLSEDSVIHLTSGLFDPAKSTVLSYLHKAIRPMNQLRFVEDATVIYRVSRAPERRVFYVDVGNLPKAKAEQYLKDIMNKYRNKLVYDAGTGEIKDQTRHISMLEDFWMPRRGEGKSTEITTLPAGQNLGQMEDVLYFEKKLYKALGVPASRLESNQGFSLGRASEITRDEIKFDKFVDKLRSRFSILFDEMLARQLALKGVCTLEEWNTFKMDIHYNFVKDNNFTELKEAELLTNRLNLLTIVDPFVGRYYSKYWVQENVLMLDEEEIEEMEKQMDKENEEMAKDAEKAAAQGAPPADPMAPPAGSSGAPGDPAQAPAKTPEDLNDRFKKTLGAAKS
jgi:hypothetical protein